MALIFGVDSTVAANARLTNGYHMYDWVMRMNRFPAFWGRALTGEDAVTADELEYLRGKNCKIALILRDLTEAGVSASDGTADALRAVEAAKALGCPYHVGIIHSHESFYHEENDAESAYWSRKGALGADMESAALFTIGRLRGMKTASILNNVVVYGEDTANAIGGYVNGESLTAIGERNEILTALEAFYRLEQERTR